ncbi:coiled-coil domain-containing protein mad1 [Scheffersomyces spartinae]|uniref:Spindle assembly checkpoint component MAD1 n=1 Tax=Scheffersomyces spartinae TaxID=45513 RepID=A0A9P7VC78_9ASCO|nr:coiled-coil domain-containing protein mad1 [Scheffersomyces spartinae]KAG7194841.1 coiled-coil domain-containing protein mad1 [Scheffersomyces spartinae]
MTTSRLQFQINSLQTEKQLLEQNRLSMAERYEQTIKAKNDRLASLQANFDYVLDQKKELESKCDNQLQISSKKAESTDKLIVELESESKELKQTVRQHESTISHLSTKLALVESDVNVERNLGLELKGRNKTLNEEIERLYETNQQLLTQANTNANSMSIIDNLHSTIESLQKENNQLKLENSKLLQERTSIEVLKQKNITLTEKLQAAEMLEEKCCKLEIENIELNQKFDDVFQVITETVENFEKKSSASLVYDFLTQFTHLKNENLVLQDKLNIQLTEGQERRHELASLMQDLDHFKSEYTEIDMILKKKDETITQLENQCQLNLKEIQFLRKSLHDDQHYNLLLVTSNNNTNPAIDEYLSKLEKSVDKLRSENNNLRKQSQQQLSSPISGMKRARSDSNSTTSESSIKKLQKDNIELSITVENLKTQVNQYKKKVKHFEDSQKKKKELNVLQLKLNPISKDQFVKQQVLSALRKENEELISMYINKAITVNDLIPKSIFERQEIDKQILQSKIDQLSKRLTRLRDTYAQKSKDILSIVSKYFGYVIEFLPSPLNPHDLTSRLKLTPKSIQAIDKSSYVIIDLECKNLKAYGNHVFKQLFDEIDQEIDGDPTKQIPCLLSAITLKVHEKYKTK